MQLGWEPAIAGKKHALVFWLEKSWQVIVQSLNQWTVDDLWRTFEKEYMGTVYRVSCQWVIWRIQAHDLHHGGELAVLLGVQGIPIPELGDLGGHLTMPPKVR